MKIHRKNRAFTLIEMLGVLAIVALLLSISTISFRHSQAKARDVVRKTDLQMIADALISYANDHGHFPSSIYDNWQGLTISQALNSITSWWIYKYDNGGFVYEPTPKSIPYLPTGYFITETVNTAGWSQNEWHGDQFNEVTVLDTEKLIANKNNEDIKDVYDPIISTIDNFENETPIDTINIWDDYAIVTQWMCTSSLRKYLVDEWYISAIPSDPSWESVNLSTNICMYEEKVPKWLNANDEWWSINNGCYSITNTWCTQICKEWYVYVSDWEHFALIAHMENENWWNYNTTATTTCEKPLSCEVAEKCENTSWKSLWTSTKQLPCDITDEFTNSFNCIQENWVVEYSTWEYYFYIY